MDTSTLYKDNTIKMRAGTRILFINPPSIPYTHAVKALNNSELDIPQPVSMPMGILYLAAMLERERPNVQISVADLALAIRDFADSEQRYDSSFDQFIEDSLAKAVARDFVPDLVGLSILFSTAHKSAGHIAEAVRRRWPSAQIMAGGMHATNAVSSLLEFPAITYVCRGEAESIITQVVDCVHDGRDCQEIQGIYGREKLSSANGKATELAPGIEDLDLIPYPAWHLLPMEMYVNSSRSRHIGNEQQESREATIITTRGCPFSCSFCSSWTVHGRRMRFRSTANIIGEIDILTRNYRVNTIIPEDDLFTVKKSRIMELCQTVVATFGDSLTFQFPNGLSVATLDDDVIKAMTEMGMKVANIAIESGSPYVQRHIIKKNCNLDRARKVVQSCSDQGIVTRAYFVVGFPGETVDQIRETFDYAKTISTDWNVFMIAAPLVGSEVYQQMLDRGDIDSSYNWDSAFFQERQFDTHEVKAAVLKDMVYDANIRINFFGNYNLHIGRYDRAIDLFSNIINTYPGHLAAHYCIGTTYRQLGQMEKCRDALAHCEHLLKDAGSEMARSQFAQFPDLFTDLRLWQSTGCSMTGGTQGP